LCLAVDENSVTPLETFGKFTGFATAGWNWVGCCTTGGRPLSLRLQQSHIPIGTRTKDNVFVHIDLSIQWMVIQDYNEIKNLAAALKPVSKKVKNARSESSSEEGGEHDLEINSELQNLTKDDFYYRAAYKTTIPDMQLKSHAEEYFRITVAKYKMDKLFDLGMTITNECCAVLNRAMNDFGYLIKKVVIRDIYPEEKVRKAMNDIVASQKERDSQINRAEADKLTRIKAAEADAEVSRLHGEGIALQRQAIIGGLRKSVEDFSSATHTDTKAVMSLMVMSQHTDMVKESIKEARGVSLLLSATPTTATDLENEIRVALKAGGSSSGHHIPQLTSLSGGDDFSTTHLKKKK